MKKIIFFTSSFYFFDTSQKNIIIYTFQNKQIWRTKSMLRFFLQENSNKFFFIKIILFYCNLLYMPRNLAHIRVDFEHNFFFYLCVIWETCDLVQKIKFLGAERHTEKPFILQLLYLQIFHKSSFLPYKSWFSTISLNISQNMYFTGIKIFLIKK